MALTNINSLKRKIGNRIAIFIHLANIMNVNIKSYTEKWYVNE